MTTATATRTAGRSGPRERLVHVIQGEFAIVEDPTAILTTLLGSCVAVCMRDSSTGIGGMNHFLLPGDMSGASDSLKYGVNAMELLINGLLQRGAGRKQLEAKLFGGAHVLHGIGAIGEKNAEFARKFLDAEGIPCLGESLGGDKARRVRYWPATGRASQLFLNASPPEVLKSEVVKPQAAAANPAAGSVELF